MSRVLLEAQNITKSFPLGGSELSVLKGISLKIHEGEAMCIVGSSGSGKSTLLHILGTLDRPTSGTLSFGGEDLLVKDEEALAKFRHEKVGFVFQFHHLLSEFTAVENVMIPCRLAGESKDQANTSAKALLEQLNMGHRLNFYPNQLSGGELQRVAIARALVRRPKILFADEPTGNLDSQNGMAIQQLFFKLRDTYGVALVVVTHDIQFARRFGRVVRLADGQSI